jgi:hypothetical protein
MPSTAETLYRSSNDRFDEFDARPSGDNESQHFGRFGSGRGFGVEVGQPDEDLARLRPAIRSDRTHAEIRNTRFGPKQTLHGIDQRRGVNEHSDEYSGGENDHSSSSRYAQIRLAGAEVSRDPRPPRPRFRSVCVAPPAPCDCGSLRPE